MRLFLIISLITHSLVTLFTLKDAGFMGPFPPFNELATYQIFADLIISLTILLTFIYQEVRRKSLSQKLFWICALTTPLIGSFAPLLYLIWEKRIFQAD